MLQMMNCPACGAANSVKKEVCYQCNAPLHVVAETVEEKVVSRPPKLCSECSHSCLFAPHGYRLKEDEIWCAHLESAIAVDHPAGECYSQPFEWRREQTLG
jgi:ribosomal protein S27AE